jgi:hypothetical protein
MAVTETRTRKYQCDECGATVVAYGGKSPQHWINARVGVGASRHRTPARPIGVTKHFCSESCARLFVAGELSRRLGAEA